ncbi:hypothetical protein [Deinococcus maricopensis]|uniref:hypothetical protein n=1 Tax=Deinococcus maricopensis TaxID=309887 RepID=UPI0002F5E17A|nr:hypothetical protein [Deinococcus maricopensis]
MTFPWLDLLAEGDIHPRRFDSTKTLDSYLRRIERLDDEARAALLRDFHVGPPLARRAYRILPVRPPEPGETP